MNPFYKPLNVNQRSQITLTIKILHWKGRQLKGGNLYHYRTSHNNDTLENVSSRIHKALQMRLSMVLPYVASNRWHEGMSIGALPQNAYHTAQQLDEMAAIVLNYALRKEHVTENNATNRAAVIAAYAASELHLFSDGKDGTVSGNSLALSGEQYHAAWTFLQDRCAELAGGLKNRK